VRGFKEQGVTERTINTETNDKVYGHRERKRI